MAGDTPTTRSDNDLALARRAVERGMVSHEALAGCESLIDQALNEGLPAPRLAQLLVQRGLLDVAQLADLLRPEPHPPRRLGRFMLVREIARGGMGVVYEALDPQLRRPVAIKALPAGRDDEQMVARLRREAQLAGRLAPHPGVITIHEVDRAEGPDGRALPYVVMDLVEGGTLGDALVERPLDDVMPLLTQVVAAMAHAHTHGVIHRDLKPGNVLLDTTGRAVVTDFGLATAREAPELTRLTATDAILGTPSYMAPEQVRGDGARLGPHTDVWALGVILYQTLTGTLPFHAHTPVEAYQAILTADPVPPRQLATGVPRDLQTICLKALAKRPSGRYRDAGALLADLERWRDGHPIQARPPGPVYRLWRWAGRHRLAVAVGLAALLVAGAVLGVQRWRDRRDTRRTRDALVAEADRLLARLPSGTPAGQARQAALEALLRATAALDRALELAPDGALRSRRLAAGRRLGALALAGRDHALADWALAQLVPHGLPETELATWRGRIAGERTARATARREQATAIVDDVTRGLSRPERPPHAPTLDDHVYALLGLRGPEVVAVLAAALERLGRQRREHPDADWSSANRDLARLACAVLGRIDRDAAVPPLVGWAETVRDRELSVVVGVALCDTRRAAARPALEAIRSRLDARSPEWQRVARRMGRLPAAPGAPTDAAELVGRAQRRLEAGDLAGAMIDYRAAAAAAPGDAGPLIGIGRVHDRSGEWPDALAAYDRALAVEPDDPTARANRALVQQKLGRHDRAVADAGRVLARHPDHLLALKVRGRSLRILGRPTDALIDLDRAVSLAPRDLEARHVRARARSMLGQGAGALADVEEALRLDPGSADSYAIRGTLRANAGDLAAAVRDATEAIRLDPRHAGAYCNRGLARWRLRQRSGALLDFNQAVELKPDDMQILVNRGNVFTLLGKHERAQLDYDAAVRHARGHYLPYIARALFARDQGRLRDALADLDAAVQRAGRSPQPRFARGKLRLRMKDLAGAEADFDALVRSDPHSPSGHLMRGVVRLARGNTDGALADFDRTLQIDGKSVIGRLQRATIREQKGDLAGALSDIEAALKTDPRHVKALVRKALLLARDPGGRREARALLRQAETLATPARKPEIARLRAQLGD